MSKTIYLPIFEYYFYIINDEYLDIDNHALKSFKIEDLSYSYSGNELRIRVKYPELISAEASRYQYHISVPVITAHEYNIIQKTLFDNKSILLNKAGVFCHEKGNNHVFNMLVKLNKITPFSVIGTK